MGEQTLTLHLDEDDYDLLQKYAVMTNHSYLEGTDALTPDVAVSMLIEEELKRSINKAEIFNECAEMKKMVLADTISKEEMLRHIHNIKVLAEHIR